jgi:thioredoxin 1
MMTSQQQDQASGPPGRAPGPAGRAVIIIAVILAVAAAFYFRSAGTGSDALSNGSASVSSPDRPGGPPAAATLPRLVDLGADKCVPCKLMAPILQELRQEYQGRFEVVFIDVWKNRSAAKQYNIQVIPTQIFYNPEGKELFRHQGFFSKEDILKTWQKHGFDFGPAAATGQEL